MTGTALYRLASRGLPRLPFRVNVRIQRLGRSYEITLISTDRNHLLKRKILH